MAARKKRLTPTDKKEQLLAGLQEVRQKIMIAAGRIPAGKTDKVFLGSWGIKEVLAHLAGWDVTNQRAVVEILQGQVPSFYEQHDRDWAGYNAQLVAEYRCEDLGELMEQVADTHQQLLTELSTLAAEEWFKDRGLRFRGYKVQIGRLMQAELSDEREHLQQIEAFLETG